MQQWAWYFEKGKTERKICQMCLFLTHKPTWNQMPPSPKKRHQTPNRYMFGNLADAHKKAEGEKKKKQRKSRQIMFPDRRIHLFTR
jgi:hypothetical protein